jgi:2-polyprenyl-3-methyl-5-hydroxy-6-metoxy-1,4-benzoquinol methylase
MSKDGATMDNGMTATVLGQFDRLSSFGGGWDHNRHYQGEILRRAGRRRRALDIGCGTGELTRALALRCSSVVGVDASGGMIGEARKRNWGLAIEYVEGDAEAYLRGRRGEFDFIASVAALHHMDEASVLGLCKEALSPGGVLVVLDLFKESSLVDYAVSGAASILNPLFSLAHRGRLGQGAEEKAAWEDHLREDRYLTLGELRAAAEERLGAFTLERKLFWRYVLAYEKP